jgi:hypothetical protein
MKLIIPSRLADITLGQWLKYRQVCLMPDFNDEVDRFALVTIFCNITIESALKIRAADFDEVVNQVRRVLVETPNFVQRFMMDGVEYGVIPNFDEMSAAELIDLDGYMGEEENYDAALAVAYRPVEGKLPAFLRNMVPAQYRNLYNIEDYAGSEKYREKMQGANLEVLFGLQLFFYSIAKRLVKDTPQLLEEVAATQTGEAREILIKSGAGISRSLQ